MCSTASASKATLTRSGRMVRSVADQARTIGTDHPVGTTAPTSRPVRCAPQARSPGATLLALGNGGF